MYKKVLITNHKGGVGKSTVADEVAFALERMGYNVCFTKLDPQRTSHEPSLTDEDTDFQVIDTPPTVSEKFAGWCRGADIIVLPTRASIPDWDALKECLAIIEQSKTEASIGVVVNFFDSRRKADRDFVETLEGRGLKVWATIPQSTSITKAQARKVSVIEEEEKSLKTKPSNAFNELANVLVKEK